MAKIDLLSAARVKSEKRPGDYLDGRGLYLQVRGESSKSWLLKYALEKRAREMGLGSAFDISLSKAREIRDQYRELIAQGIDPIDSRKAEGAAKALERAKAITFGAAAKRLITAKKHGWKNPKHADQWNMTLLGIDPSGEPAKFDYCKDIRDLPVQSIDTNLVMKILDPIWPTKNETASRLRGRIENVIDAAKARKEFVGDNPARWEGHLENLLASRRDVQKRRHQPSLPYEKLPGFMKALLEREAVAARALEFHILTAARPGNAVKARWEQIDWKGRAWNIADDEMKIDVAHRVPLSPAAIALLEKLKKEKTSEYIFSLDGENHLSDAAMGALIERMNSPKVTWVDPKQKNRQIVPHGFRSTFRTWGGEETSFARELLEKAIAHTVGDETERSYDRGDLFERRRKLMDAWADYCEGKVVGADNVVSMRA